MVRHSPHHITIKTTTTTSKTKVTPTKQNKNHKVTYNNTSIPHWKNLTTTFPQLRLPHSKVSCRQPQYFIFANITPTNTPPNPLSNTDTFALKNTNHLNITFQILIPFINSIPFVKKSVTYNIIFSEFNTIVIYSNKTTFGQKHQPLTTLFLKKPMSTSNSTYFVKQTSTTYCQYGHFHPKNTPSYTPLLS